jgi:ribonuclease HI
MSSKNTTQREAIDILKRLAQQDTTPAVSRLLDDTDEKRTRELLLWAARQLEASIPAETAGSKKTDETAVCTAYIDGASIGNPGPSGIGGVLLDEKGVELEKFSEHIGSTTNNVAEYRALIHALNRFAALGIDHVRIFTDSQLLQRQTVGEWKIKDEKLKELNRTIRDSIGRFSSFEITHVGREGNRTADRLAKRAAEK